MKEFTLIENHFNIKFDNNNIYFKSLLYNKDFEYFKNGSITRYYENGPVYNFLFAVKNLLEMEIANVIDGELVISNDDFMHLNKGDFIDSNLQYNLSLKLPVLFGIKMRDRSLITESDFRIIYNILDSKFKDCEIIGCFAISNNEFYLLNEHLYSLFKAINYINNIPNDENRESNIWQAINSIKEESVFTESILKGFFNNENIIVPSSMYLETNVDMYNNLELVLNLSGLTDDEQVAFKEKVSNLVDAQSSYTFELNGKVTRVVLIPKIKENFKTYKNMPTRIRRPEDIDKILKNPAAPFKNPDVVSLDNFSERVVDLGLYKAISSSSDSSQISWQYPIEKELYDIAGTKFIFKINDKDEKEEFSSLLNDAIINDFAFFTFNNISIPLTEQNLDVLKMFLKNKDDDSTDNSIRIVKTVTLKTDKDELITVDVTEELLEDLKQQIDQIRHIETEDWELAKSLRILTHTIPLTIENVKQIKEILEIHFILAEDNEIQTEIDEIMCNAYCNLVAELPKDIKTEVKSYDGEIIPLVLKEHQQKGLAWLQNSFKMKTIGRTGVLLADDMGLGKTLQILSFIFWLKDKYANEYFKPCSKKPVLIIAPVILLENWQKEYYNFFNDTLGAPLVLHGEKLKQLRVDDGTFLGKEEYQLTESCSCVKTYLDIDEIKKSNIVITNYDTLVNYEYSFAKIDWSIVVLDEAQEIKEPQSHKSRVARGLKADFRVACTGTPVENKLLDLWTIFNFLQPNLLGTRSDFNSSYKNNMMDDTKYKELQKKFFYNKPYAYILRRLKTTALKDSLPEKYIKTYEVPLNDFQINKYNELKNKMLDNPKNAVKILGDMNKFSQHPRLLMNEAVYSVDTLLNESPKLKKLIDIVDSIKLKQEKVIIFCLYLDIQKYLKIVLENKFRLDNIDIINGAAKNRQMLIDKFQEKPNNFNVLILSPLAAGVGLTIAGANHVIHYGRWWNPAKENQATDRAYRIGQKKDVYVHYLLEILPDKSSKTFDENLHELILSKMDVANNFLKPNDIDVSASLIKAI